MPDEIIMDEETKRRMADWLAVVMLMDLVDQELLTAKEAERARRIYVKKVDEKRRKEQTCP